MIPGSILYPSDYRQTLPETDTRETECTIKLASGPGVEDDAVVHGVPLQILIS